MIKQVVIIMVILCNTTCFAKQVQDSIQSSNLMALERLENQLNTARDNGDIQTEILVLNDLLI